MHNLEIFHFEEDEIYVIVDTTDGTRYIPIVRIADNLGLHPDGQVQKVRKDKKFNSCVIAGVGKDGKNRQMICIPENRLTAFLFSINPKRVKIELRDKIELYQEELADALHDWATKGIAINPDKLTDLDLLGSIAEGFTRTYNTLKDHKAKLREHDDRLNDLEFRTETDFVAIPGEYGIWTPSECKERYKNAKTTKDIKVVRRKITTLIQFIADAEKLPVPRIWSQSYANYNESEGVNLKLRAVNQTKKTGKTIKPIDVLEELKLLDSFYSETYNYWSVDMIHNK